MTLFTRFPGLACALSMVGLLVLVSAGRPVGAEPAEPPPGDPLRTVLLETIRPYVIDDLGGEIEFVVETLLVEGDRAYAELHARRPGGGEIDLTQTPLHLSRGIPVDLIDGPFVVAFLHRAPLGWRVVVHSTGATDAWYAGYDCTNYAAFFDPRLCGG